MRTPRLCLVATTIVGLSFGCDAPSNTASSDLSTANIETSQAGTIKGKVKQKRAPGVHGSRPPRPTEL